jgi:hypothetical protein
VVSTVELVQSGGLWGEVQVQVRRPPYQVERTNGEPIYGAQPGAVHAHTKTAAILVPSSLLPELIRQVTSVRWFQSR